MPPSLPAPKTSAACNPVRRALIALGATSWLAPTAVFAGDSGARALRQMQIHRLSGLGLEVWVENQPVWSTELSDAGGHPGFVAQSPEDYHPPAVMSYGSWPKERVPDDLVTIMASSAIQRASANFGLNAGEARAIVPVAMRHGELNGFEASFIGKVGARPMDVKIFVGQAPGKFPVVMSVYTLQGKLHLLDEVLRRAWGKVRYLR
jgi:hypothetical protein